MESANENVDSFTALSCGITTPLCVQRYRYQRGQYIFGYLSLTKDLHNSTWLYLLESSIFFRAHKFFRRFRLVALPHLVAFTKIIHFPRDGAVQNSQVVSRFTIEVAAQSEYLMSN